MSLISSDSNLVIQEIRFNFYLIYIDMGNVINKIVSNSEKVNLLTKFGIPGDNFRFSVLINRINKLV